MAIYFDKRNRLIIDKPYQAKEICVYCYINDDIKVDCKFIEFNTFYCDRCNNTWKINQNKQQKSRSIQHKNNEDSLFSIALIKNKRKPKDENSSNLTITSIKKKDRYQKAEIAKCPTCGAVEHNIVQDCPVFLGIKSIRKAEKKSKRKPSVTPPKQPKTELCPHCKTQVKAKKLPKHIAEDCQNTNRNRGNEIICNKSDFIGQNNSISKPREGRHEQPLDWSLCKQCNVEVRPKNLERHLFKIHGIRISKNPLTRGKPNILFKNNDTNDDRDSDWYECNNVDSRDGSKYLGYLRREYENSQFGSFPLHDDYGDESWAD